MVQRVNAARYQHVTDALRSQVAVQVGDLIWNPTTGEGNQQPSLMVRSGSLGVVLAAAEECVATHRSGSDDSAAILAAIADLRAVLPPADGVPGPVNETKNETRRPSE